jgi:hypothetical protein
MGDHYGAGVKLKFSAAGMRSTGDAYERKNRLLVEFGHGFAPLVRRQMGVPQGHGDGAVTRQIPALCSGLGDPLDGGMPLRDERKRGAV